MSQVIYYNPSPSENIGYYFTYNPSVIPLKHRHNQYKSGDLVLFYLSDSTTVTVNAGINGNFSRSMPSMSGSRTQSSHLGVLHQLGLPYTNPYLLKQIVAVAGDEVSVTPNGVYVNNTLYANSKAQQYNMFHGVRINLLPMSYGKFRLADDEYFMLGKTANSYDSRYFGVIRQQQIYRRAVFIDRY